MLMFASVFPNEGYVSKKAYCVFYVTTPKIKGCAFLPEIPIKIPKMKAI